MKLTRFFRHSVGAAAVASALFVGTVWARPDGPPAGPRPNPVAHLSERLQLSQAQEAKIQAIFDQHFAARQHDRKAQRVNGPSPEDRAAQRQKFETERATFDTELRAILTPEQQAALDQIKSEAMERAPDQRPQPAGNPMQALIQRLDLSQAQQSQLKSLFERRSAERKAAQEAREAQLTPEQRAERQARRQQRWARMEAERQALDNEIKAVLTPEQRVEFEKMNAERASRRGPGRQPEGPEG